MYILYKRLGCEGPSELEIGLSNGKTSHVCTVSTLSTFTCAVAYNLRPIFPVPLQLATSPIPPLVLRTADI